MLELSAAWVWSQFDNGKPWSGAEMCHQKMQIFKHLKFWWFLAFFSPILGDFGSPLGVIFIDFSLVFVRFREHSRCSKNIVSRPVLSPTWAILDRFWPPKRLQDGSQNGSKTMKTSWWILIIFEIDFWSILSASNSETYPSKNGKRAKGERASQTFSGSPFKEFVS